MRKRGVKGGYVGKHVKKDIWNREREYVFNAVYGNTGKKTGVFVLQ
jgi:hypothetical protein